MKHSARIATLSALLALVCVSQAQAARSIRTDMGDWVPCPLGVCDYPSDIATQYGPLGSMGFSFDGSTPLGPTDPLWFDPAAPFGSWAVTYLRDYNHDFTTATPDVRGWQLTNANVGQIAFFSRGLNDWLLEFNYADSDLSGQPDVFLTGSSAFQWGGSTYVSDNVSLSIQRFRVYERRSGAARRLAPGFRYSHQRTRARNSGPARWRARRWLRAEAAANGAPLLQGA